MSRLNLYVPAAREATGETCNRLPASVRWPGRASGTISFEKAAAELKPGHVRPVVRATCPDCGCGQARAVSLTDATVVGHQCTDCDRQWPVMPRAEGCG